MGLHQEFAISGIWAERQFALQKPWAADVAFGSKADIAAISSHVRFTPKADMVQHIRDVRFVPKADIVAICT